MARKNENKTVPTEVSPADFIGTVDNDTRREDAATLLELMGRVTGFKAKMWGPSIIGFGRYHYVYDSGREGDYLMVGFSPRKANTVIYLMPGYEDLAEPLSRLGKHKMGKSCLYINKLDDVDLTVVEELVTRAVTKLDATYDTYPE